MADVIALSGGGAGVRTTGKNANGQNQSVTVPGQAILDASGLRSNTATFTDKTLSTTSATLLAANPNRNGAVIVNGGDANLYVDLSGGTATSTRYTYMLEPGDTLEVPFACTGTITGVWANIGTGKALITEFA